MRRIGKSARLAQAQCTTLRKGCLEVLDKSNGWKRNKCKIIYDVSERNKKSPVANGRLDGVNEYKTIYASE